MGFLTRESRPAAAHTDAHLSVDHIGEGDPTTRFEDPKGLRQHLSLPRADSPVNLTAWGQTAARMAEPDGRHVPCPARDSRRSWR
eukprot:scaffold7235_cov583-Prasinococcus_capsulatus_cf.AAC.6